MRIKPTTTIYLILILISGIGYCYNRESRQVAAKYDMTSYGVSQSRTQFIGFYGLEKWKEGNYRWSGRRGVMKLQKTGDTTLSFYLAHPDMERLPVETTIYLNDRELDQFTTVQPGFFQRCYNLGTGIENRVELRIDVARTWQPLALGLSSDPRHLGIAVGPISQNKPCIQ